MIPIENLKDKIIQKLKEKKIDPSCKICEKNNWSVVDQPVALTIINPDGRFSLPPPHIPSGALICNNCGNIRLISLLALGIIEYPKLKEKNDNKED
ncbi:MAG: hypothetical protein ABIC04_07895 [Nanoarchaeota archaeon]